MASVTSKVINRLNIIENMVCECHQSRDIDVEYISGIINTIKMFTKEMKENTNFINLRGSMMV